MHLPDGFLDLPTAAATAGAAAIGVGAALRRARRVLPAERVPLLGLGAAFVFAAQMLNFPVAAGTSGHLVGATLCAVLLGAASATVVLTAVLLLQCLLFADGGITALGANVLNLAVLAPLVGWGASRLARGVLGGGRRGTIAGAAFGAWCSTVAAALACALELAASGTVPGRLALPAMGGVHMLIGLGEALITALVVAAVARARPELIAGVDEPATPRYRAFAAAGLLLAAALAVGAAPLASAAPDGLERVAARLGFAGRASAATLPGPFADYAVPGLGAVPSTIVVGLAGTLVAFALAWALARALVPRRAA
jgi:cobalt/nickel transport system permease protein